MLATTKFWANFLLAGSDSRRKREQRRVVATKPPDFISAKKRPPSYINPNLSCDLSMSNWLLVNDAIVTFCLLYILFRIYHRKTGKVSTNYSGFHEPFLADNPFSSSCKWLRVNDAGWLRAYNPYKVYWAEHWTSGSTEELCWFLNKSISSHSKQRWLCSVPVCMRINKYHDL